MQVGTTRDHHLLGTVLVPEMIFNGKERLDLLDSAYVLKGEVKVSHSLSLFFIQSKFDKIKDVNLVASTFSDYGFERKNIDEECTPIEKEDLDNEIIPEDCPEGTNYSRTQG